MADISNITLPNEENYDIKDKAARNDIAINRTTLGYSKKNLFDWKVSNKAQNFYTTVTSETDTTISMSSKTKWSRISYKLPTVEIDKSYVLSVKISDLDESGGNSTMLILSSDLSGSNIINGVSLENNGVYELEFNVQGNEESIYLLLCLNWSGTNFTDSSNSFTVSEVMLRYADITDSTYEPYKENVDERLIKNKSDIAVNKSTLGTQCKNLLNETGYLSSIKTATNGTLSKSDNSITLTATSNDCYTAPFFVGDNGYRIPVSPNTTYILSWESNNSNYGIIHVFMNGIVSKQQAANNSVTKYLKFTTDIDATFITIRFSVRNSGDSITYSNIMLRYADITDDTYEPYKESVDDRITQNKSDIAVNKTTLGYQCKNLFKNTAVSQTAYGVTFTVNADKSITVNGTATRNIYFNIGEYYFEADKQYILNGCPSGGSGTKYFLAYSGMAGHQYDTGSGTTFSVSESVTKAMLLVIVSGQTVSNLTFYPMLRYADILDDTYEPYQPSVIEQIIGAYFPMTDSKRLANNTDLNTITEIGNYVCYSGGSAATMTNCPTTAGGFRLIVTNLIVSTNESSTIRYQWIIPNNLDGILCFRRKFDISTNTFNSWYSFGGTVVS